MKVKMPTDLASLLASVQEPQGGKGKGSGPGHNYIGDWWVSAAAPISLNLLFVKDFTSLSSALPPTTILLHYQLTVILDGIKIMVCYESSATFFIIS